MESNWNKYDTGRCALRAIALIGASYFLFLLPEYPDTNGFVTPHSPLWIQISNAERKMNLSSR